VTETKLEKKVNKLSFKFIIKILLMLIITERQVLKKERFAQIGCILLLKLIEIIGLYSITRDHQLKGYLVAKSSHFGFRLLKFNLI
jgi:hypothetical protein